MDCPDCQRQIPPDSRFCSYCGQPLQKCESCELFFDADAAFCGSCGDQLGTSTSPDFEPPNHRNEAVFGYLYEADDPASFHSLCDGDNTVGAGGNNDIVIDHPTISWNHAIVLCGDNRVRVQDSASTNGTFVDGVTVRKPMPVEHGEAIRFGDRDYLLWLTPDRRG